MILRFLSWLAFVEVAIIASGLNLITVVNAESHRRASVIVPQFSVNVIDELRLEGNARVKDNSLQLTVAENWMRGVALWKGLQELGKSRSFSTYFTMQMSEPICHKGLGADGISFLLQAGNRTKGAAGFGVGYAGTEMSVAIEFDTFVNDELGDPPGQHIGLSLHGDPSSYSTSLSPYVLNDGRTYHAWIEYDGAAKLLEVRISDGPNRPIAATMRTQVDLSSVLADWVYIGFSASTGACNEEHIIKSFYFDNQFLKEGIRVTSFNS